MSKNCNIAKKEFFCFVFYLRITIFILFFIMIEKFYRPRLVNNKTMHSSGIIEAVKVFTLNKFPLVKCVVIENASYWITSVLKL